MAKKKMFNAKTKKIITIIGIFLAVIILGSLIVPAIRNAANPEDVIINEQNKDYIFDENGTSQGTTGPENGETIKVVKADNFNQLTTIKSDMVFATNNNNLSFFKCKMDGVNIYGVSFNYRDSETTQLTLFENYEVKETKFPLTGITMVQHDLAGEVETKASSSEAALEDFSLSQTIYFESNGIDYRFTVSNIHKFLQNILIKFTDEYANNADKNTVTYKFNLTVDTDTVETKDSTGNWIETEFTRVEIPSSYINVETQYMYYANITRTSAGCEVYL